MLLERLGLHQCQGKYGQPVRSTGRIPFEGASVMVPPIAKHPCTCRHRWNSNPTQGPFVKRMAMHLGHFTVISLAENVTTLYSVLSVCQVGHNVQSLKSITILDRTSVPLSVTSTAWLAASLVASGNSNAVQAIFTTLKRSERGGSMMRLCYQWTFTPRNLLGIGRD